MQLVWMLRAPCMFQTLWALRGLWALLLRQVAVAGLVALWACTLLNPQAAVRHASAGTPALPGGCRTHLPMLKCSPLSLLAGPPSRGNRSARQEWSARQKRSVWKALRQHKRHPGCWAFLAVQHSQELVVGGCTTWRMLHPALIS